MRPNKLTGKLHREQELGAGVNAEVYRGVSVEGPVAIKIAHSRDGTLNYLEWCFLARMKGTIMQGMPEVYGLFPTLSVIDKGTKHEYVEKGYVAVMRLYREQESGRKVVLGNLPPYLERLRTAYRRYAAEIGGKEMDDLHSGNILFDIGTNSHIIIDPNSDEYVP